MIFRYPGGKKKVAGQLLQYIPNCREFREPFFGSGAVTFAFAKMNPTTKLWINDKDTGIASLWTTVIQNPAALCDLVQKFTPSTEAYREFVDSLISGGDMSDLNRGFRKLAIHQMSYSGLGLKAGGPIGGWGQHPEDNPKQYDIGCRWNPDSLVKGILRCHQLLKGRCFDDRCTCLDAEVLVTTPGEDVVLYLDPPYVEVGQELYLLGYVEQDHRKLAQTLASCDHKWVLSYDDHPLIRELYKEFWITEMSWAYTINSMKGNKGKELLICREHYQREHLFHVLW